MMFYFGIGLMIFGALIGGLGWVLNTNTPIQQPLPAVGVGLALVGLGFVLWFH